MPRRVQNAQQNFAAGVLSPRYSAAIESEAFNRGLQQGTNFIISSQGGAVYREGFQYIRDALSNEPFRIFQFRRGGDVSDILLEVAEGTIRYWWDVDGDPQPIVDLTTLLTDEDTGPPQDFLIDEDGDFLSLGVITSSNPYEAEDMDTLYFTNQDSYGIICSERHPPLYITSRADDTIISELFPLSRVPNFIYNDVNSPQISAYEADWLITFPESWTTYQLYYYVIYNGVYARTQYPYDPTTPATNAANIQAGLYEAAIQQGFATTFVVTSVDTTGLTYTVEVDGADSGWDAVVVPVYGNVWVPFSLSPISQAISTEDVTELAWSYPGMVYQIDDTHYYQCIRTHVASADSEPGNPDSLVTSVWEVYWRDLGIAVPDGWTYQYPSGNDWSLQSGSPLKDNIYSPKNRGFPTVAVFHEQRLILMANKDNPTAIYGSAIGSFQSFTPGPNDNDPWLYVLDSSDTPEIKWARSQKGLLVGTSAGEWTINAEVTITPTDISAVQQNNSRSHLTMAAQYDIDVFYIEQGMRKLIATQFGNDQRSFFTTNISVMAENLVSTFGISHIAVSTIPEIFFTMSRNNGQPIWLAYDKNSSVLAFSECETDGSVYDIASYFSVDNQQDYTFYATKRNNRWVLERMHYPTSKSVSGLTESGVVHLDGWVTGIVSRETITGLGHLEGKQVYVLIDDAWQIGEYIVSNGLIQLNQDYTGRAYAVGLPYTGIMRTFEDNLNPNGTTALGTKRRWNRLTTRVLNSALPEIYNQRAYDRRPQIPMGTSDNVITGVHNITQNNVGFADGSITVEMNRPYPLYVIGFYGQYEVEER